MEELTVAALTILTLITASILLLLYSFIKNPKSQNPSNNLLPPGPRGLPILGYLPFLQPNLHHHFTQLAQKYGPIYKLWLGSKLTFVIASPALIKQVVREHDAVFANRDPPASAIAATQGLDIFWAPYGPYWRDMRKLFVREMLNNKNLEASYVLRREEVRKVVACIDRDHAGDQKGLEVGEAAFETELNVVMSLLWGGTIDGGKRESLGREFREKMGEFVELLGAPNVSDFLPVLARFDFQGVVRRMRGVLPALEEILDYVIKERREMMEADGGGGGKRDFLGILLELKGQEVAESSFGDTQIKAILLDVIVGGIDTTATTFEWVMAELLNNPDVMEKVQNEVTNVVGTNNIVEESHTSHLHYLEAVVKETFRLHPPLPLIVPRLPSESCTVGGYTIPKGSPVFLNMWSVYNDPSLWDNPSEFRPERFLNDEAKFDYMGNNFQFLRFGSGRRLCPGIALGERMVMHLLATLVHSFDWRLPEGESSVDMSEKFGIVMKKSKPLTAVPSRRLQRSDLYA